jgi:hypothetical protein
MRSKNRTFKPCIKHAMRQSGFDLSLVIANPLPRLSAFDFIDRSSIILGQRCPAAPDVVLPLNKRFP